MNVQDLSRKVPLNKLFHVFLCIVIGAAFAGFFVGVSEKHEPVRPISFIKQEAPAASEFLPAVTYREMNAINCGPNRAWKNELTQLSFNLPVIGEAVPTQRPEDKLASLEKRTQRRAYDGAPPVVPHKINQRSSASCLACHGQDLKVGDAIVPKISHPHYINCIQCHAESVNPELALVKENNNTFAGLSAPTQGERAWPGAPPVVPHSTQMRTDCRSCHGVTGQPGLRTSHPERNNCLQCHGPSATLDQQPSAFPLLVFQPSGDFHSEMRKNYESN